MSDPPRPMPRALMTLFIVVDVGFIAYWLVTAIGVLPPEWMFKDYDNPILSAWNWSFLPLDLAVSATGLTTVRVARRGDRWQPWALASLLLTACAGLQAIAFWVLRADFDPAWWAPNLFLLLYPLAFLPGIMRDLTQSGR